MKKCYYWWKSQLKKMVLHLTWGQVGTGCQMFSIDSFDFGKKTTDYYELVKLSPAYRVYFGVDEFITIADNLAEIEATFESIEEGSGAVLHKFITEAKKATMIKI
jgi:phytoene dehydrogenase-like protein